MPDTGRTTRWRMRRIRSIASAAIFIGALIVLGLSINVIAHQTPVRMQFDATKTRAYSLSPATRNTLQRLEGDWTIAIISLQSLSDRATQTQVSEVLRRFGEASDHITVMQIDPSQPESLMEYESLLTTLRAAYRNEIAAYDEALDRGVRVFESSVVWCQQQAAAFNSALQAMPADDPSAQSAKQSLDLVGLIADQGDAILSQVRSSRQMTDEQPMPDFETARSVLAQALTQLAQHLGSMGATLDGWANRAELDAAARRFAATGRREFASEADRLARAADPLRLLPPLEISSLGGQLQQGEVGLVIGPASHGAGRAALIPASQLFPRRRVGEAGASGIVTFDQRFRGEQIIAAAINSLLVDAMPVVVFVHAEPESMLAHRERNADLFGLASMLSLSRFQVREWPMSQPERPPAAQAEDQPVVWIIVPPIVGAKLEPSRQEQMLLQTARRLIDEGESVLLSVNPSVLPKFRQKDPWAELAAPFGLNIDSGTVISTTVRVDDTKTRTERGVAVQIYESDHLIARAVDGLHTYFHWPVKLELSETAPVGVTRFALATVPPGPMRWLDDDWLNEPSAAAGATPPGEPIRAPIPLVVAAERNDAPRRDLRNPGGSQRIVIVGSGAWMYTFIADSVVSLGGTRVALENPGNYELALASIAWLANMDQLIAPGAATRQVARLDGVTDNVKTFWRWVTMAVVPGMCLLGGGIMWLVRRR